MKKLVGVVDVKPGLGSLFHTALQQFEEAALARAKWPGHAAEEQRYAEKRTALTDYVVALEEVAKSSTLTT